MNWQLAVMLSGVMSGVAQLIGKKQIHVMSAFQSGLMRDLVTLALVGVVYMREADFRYSWPVLVIVGVGFLESISIAIYFAALRTEMAATTVFSYPFSQLLIVLGSLAFFGEGRYFDLLNPRGLFNVVSLGLTMWLMMLYGSKGKVQKFKWSTALFVSAVITAGSVIESKWAVSQLGFTPATAIFWEYIGIVGGGTIFVYGRGQNLRLGWKSWMLAIIQGLLFGVSALWIVSLLKVNPVGLSSLIRRVAIVLTTIIGAFVFYGEGKKLKGRQLGILILGMIIFGLVLTVNK